MNKPKIMGIGCFAEAKTLSRVLRRALESYIWGNVNPGDPPGGHRAMGSNGSDMIRQLIASVTSGRQFVEAEMHKRLENKKITGFFLSMDKRCLNLSLFAKGKRPELEKYTTRLEALSQLRNKRLH